jgi:DNA-binding winged helix-turn-helix (wHTH) protein
MKLRFGQYTVDAAGRDVRHGDTPRHLSRKAFDLLLLLLERRPSVVDKETLRTALWGDTAVVDANLNNLIAEIRAALGDDPQAPSFIRTVHRVGYAFVGEAHEDGEADRAAAGPTCWLQWRERTFVLRPGGNVIGRDPTSQVWVDAPGVSRRHARIDVSGPPDAPIAVLSDLDSTNGTLLRGSPLRAPATLAHEDVIRVGRASLSYRLWFAGAETRKVRRTK